jgi:uncharacterized protein YxjI
MSQPTYLLEANDFIMKKKILSLREHYDFEDLTGTKIGEADGNLFQVPAKFIVIDTHGLEAMHLEGKVLSLRKQFTFHGASGETGNHKEENSQVDWGRILGGKRRSRVHAHLWKLHRTRLSNCS